MAYKLLGVDPQMLALSRAINQVSRSVDRLSRIDPRQPALTHAAAQIKFETELPITHSSFEAQQGPTMKSRFWLGALLCSFASVAFAQEGNTKIEIRQQHSKYPFVCYASSCMESDRERQNRVKLAETVARNSCSVNMTGGNLVNCEKDKEAYEATKQCQEQLCSNAECKSTNLTTGKCVSAAYFRR